MASPAISLDAIMAIGARLVRVAHAEIVIARVVRFLRDIVEKMDRSPHVWNARLDERDLMRLAPRGKEIL